MSPAKRFSERAGVWDTGGLVREAVPARVVGAVLQALDDLTLGFSARVETSFWRELLKSLEWGLDLRPTNRSGFSHHGITLALLEKAVWSEFLDSCEIIYEFFADTPWGEEDSFRNALNGALVRYHSAYQMAENGQVIDATTEASEAAVEEARALLTAPAFEGPDRQYQKALAAYWQRPVPDDEDAISNAINAVEGVLRIVTETDLTFSPAIDLVREKHGLHKDLASSLKKLYSYASGAGGRHGLVGGPDADHAIAEFCLHQSAAAIVFLGRLYGHEIQRGEAQE